MIKLKKGITTIMLFLAFIAIAPAFANIDTTQTNQKVLANSQVGINDIDTQDISGLSTKLMSMLDSLAQSLGMSSPMSDYKRIKEQNAKAKESIINMQKKMGFYDKLNK